MTKHTLYGSLVLTLLLGGCTIGPDYAKPDIAVPEAFRDANGSAAIDTRWWSRFNDPELSAAVEQALKTNDDLKTAEAKVDALLGKFDQAQSYLYPQLNGNGSLTRKGVYDATGPNLRDGVTSTYAASLSLASYEIDLFGKVRRANEAARAFLLSSEYAKETVRLSVAASVAASYLKLSSLQSQIDLAQENLSISRELLEMTGLKYRHGVIDQSIVLQAESEYQNAQATLSQLEAAKISEEALYNLLLSRNPQHVSTSPLESITLPPIPEALPSSILTRRPDIAEAEQNLIAANAQIGIARAAYFPSIKLTGLLGIQSLELSDFVSNPTRLWEIAPSVTVPIFTAGRIAGEIKTAEAEHNATLSAYRKTIISAFNDTDSALGQNTKAAEQLEYQRKRSSAIQQAFEQAKLRYRVGAISYTQMLQVHQQWLAARQGYLIARQNALIASVTLFKSLGGGWSSDTQRQ
ncbi:MAG: efflux transporter outer membrane subunit [Campylobacterales bacterium]|nr:efflux transporter outer membrane subunit [Campylobacterales bacterium]